MLETPLGATRLLQPQMRRSDLVVISLWWKQRCENPRSHTPHDGTARDPIFCIVVIRRRLFKELIIWFRVSFVGSDDRLRGLFEWERISIYYGEAECFSWFSC